MQGPIGPALFGRNLVSNRQIGQIGHAFLPQPFRAQVRDDGDPDPCIDQVTDPGFIIVQNRKRLELREVDVGVPVACEHEGAAAGKPGDRKQQCNLFFDEASDLLIVFWGTAWPP